MLSKLIYQILLIPGYGSSTFVLLMIMMTMIITRIMFTDLSKIRVP